MIYLLISILFTAAVSISMRVATSRSKNRYALLTVNYITSTLLSCAFTFRSGFFPAVPGLGRTLGLGVLNGVLFLSSFLLMQYTIRKSGVVLPTVFMKLGVMVPSLVSILFFHEQPTWMQCVGFALTVIAICVINLEKGSGAVGGGLMLVILLLCNGSADGMSKVYEEVGVPELSGQFLLYTFLVALILCTAIMLKNKQRIGKTEWIYGLVIGIPNYFTTKCLLTSLATVPAVVAYPTFCVAAILLVTLAGVLFFHEKLSKRQIIGLVIVLAALVLLNI
ncbi:MAG: DMT family transporter [Clostridia bacterium]|nr:DMT family transporter [Clostridia bacterium]